MANKIFGDIPYERVIGKTLEFDNRSSDYHVVTAIIEDVPANSHLYFDFLVSFSTISSPRLETNLWWSQFYTYVLFKEGTTSENLNQKFSKIIDKYYGEESKISIFLQPLEDIYLTSNLKEEVGETGSMQQLLFLSIIAVSILIIAWINYMNLFLAKSMERANEVGVRKVLGASKQNLTIQFFVEYIMINFLSIILSFIVLVLVQRHFATWIGKDVTSILHDHIFQIIFVFLGITIGGILIGFYPAIVLSSYKSIELLGPKLKSSKSGIYFQKGLVYFQFIASFIFISSTLIVNRQIDFMKNFDLGIDIEGRIALRSPGNIDSTYQSRIAVFKNNLSNYPFVENTSFSSSIPGKKIVTSGGLKRVEGPEIDGNNAYKIDVDENFINAYDIQIIAGRDFSDNYSSEEKKVIINGAALSTLGFYSADEALNKKITWQNLEFEIIGVFENYNHLFLKEAFEPIILSFVPDSHGYITLNVQGDNYPQALEIVKSEMETIFPANPFEYTFVEANYDKQYDKITQFEALTQSFSLIAIFIAGLGLFALSAHSVEQRLKEIVIRKIFGADIKNILFLLTGNYFLISIMSAVIGAFITFFIMNTWLQNFAFPIQINTLDFVVPLVTITILMLVSVGYNCIKASVINPADSLKNK